MVFISHTPRICLAGEVLPINRKFDFGRCLLASIGTANSSTGAITISAPNINLIEISGKLLCSIKLLSFESPGSEPLSRAALGMVTALK